MAEDQPATKSGEPAAVEVDKSTEEFAKGTGGARTEFTGKIINATRWPLIRIGWESDSWVWEPPPQIEANSEATFRTASDGTTDGDITYARVSDSRVEIRVTWWVPVVGSNVYTKEVRPPGALRVERTGEPYGWSPSVVWTVTPPA